MEELLKIKKLVGNVSLENLRYVDYSLTEKFGIFVPSTGFCEYAIMPNHTHPAYMINIFVNTENLIIKQSIDVPENYYLGSIMSPDIKHQEEKGDTFKRYYAIMIDKDFFDKIYFSYSNKETPRFFWKQFIVNCDIMFYVKQCQYEYENRCIHKNERLKSIDLIITNKIIRELLQQKNDFEPISKILQIEKVEQFINENFGHKLSISKLANLVDMSSSNFIRIFKKEIGIAPIEYVLKVRIEKSKKYLKESNKNITEIALCCGFNSASHFSSCFKKHVGQAPLSYRKKYTLKKFEKK